MAWLQICQGLVLLGWVARLVRALSFDFTGQDKREPPGALGVCVTVIWYALTAAVIIRSGAVSTIVGYP